MLTAQHPSVQESARLFVEAATVAQKWRQVRTQRTVLQRAMSRAFKRQERIFMQRFSGLRSKVSEAAVSEAISIEDWEPIFDRTAKQTTKDMQGPLEKAIKAALKLGALQAATELNVTDVFSLKNPRAVAYIKAHGAELVTGLNETSKERLRIIIANGADNGHSYDKLAREIRLSFTSFSVNRARLIAIQELGEAYEAGSEVLHLSLIDEGIPLEKSWLSVRDSRVSEDICRPNDREGWVPYAQAFGSGHARPLGHVGCRCTMLTRRVGSG